MHINFKKKIYIMLLASIPSLIVCYYFFFFNSFPIVFEDFDSRRYTVNALKIIENGSYKDLDVVPLYPYTISIIFKIFGLNNYHSIVLFHSFLVGAIALIIGLIANKINPRWFYLSVLLSAIWPNLVWRTTYVSPEIVLAFFVILSFYLSLLFFLEKKNYYLYSAFFFIGLASLTKTSTIFIPFFLLIFTFFFLIKKKNRKAEIIKIIFFCLISFTFVASFQFYKSYKLTGHIGYSTQSGRFLLSYYYPCLAQKYGCGTRNVEAFNYGAKKFDDQKKLLSNEDLNNQMVMNKLAKKVALELIFDLKFSELALSSSAAFVKLLYHNFYYDYLERFKLKAVHLTQTDGVLDFLNKTLKDGNMRIWLFFQIILIFFFRFLQVCGTLYFLKNKNNYLILSLFFIYFLSLLLPLAGFSTIRYRVPLEPLFILLTVSGIFFLKDLIKSRNEN